MNGRLISNPSRLLLPRNITDLCITGGTRAMLRYRFGRPAGSYLTVRAAAALYGISRESSSLAAVRLAPNPTTTSFKAQVRLGDARRSVFVSESSSLLHTLERMSRATCLAGMLWFRRQPRARCRALMTAGP
jgi:hypothetical protein